MSIKRGVFLAATGVILLSALTVSFYFNKTSDASGLLGRFLMDLKTGEAGKACAYMGSEGCACSPPGGWSAYLNYESGLEPSIAFLLGSRFTEKLNKVSAEYPDATHKNVIHRQAQVSLRFPEGNEPVLLPVKLAFGSNMDVSQLDAFSSSPYQDGMKGLTLRLRKELGRGSIQKHKDLIEIDRDSSRKPAADLLDPNKLAEEFGSDTAFLLFPSDKGNVRDATGRILKPEEIRMHLPKLKEISLRVDLVRKTTGKNWKVWKCIPEDPSLELPSGARIALRESKTL